MVIFRLSLLLLIFVISNSSFAVSFNFLVPNCMNQDYWEQASTSIESAEEKLDTATYDCTDGLQSELAACNALDEFPPAMLVCQAGAVAGCGVSVGIFGESVGVGIDDTVKIIKNCVSLIPIAAYAVSMTESGEAEEATPCLLDVFGATTDVIPQLKDLDIPEIINEFKTFNNDITNAIQSIVSTVTDTINGIDSGFNTVINALQIFPPLADLLKLVKDSINVVFSFVPIMANVEEMAPLLIMANVCNNYATGLGGIGCLALIQDTCSSRFKGKKGSVPPSTKQQSQKALKAMNSAINIESQIMKETSSQQSAQAKAQIKLAKLKQKMKKCKKIEKIISSIPVAQRNKIPEADIVYFNNNCKDLVKN